MTTTIITGGSRGIGAATVRRAAEAGHAICFSYGRDRASADAVVAEAEALGAKAIAVQADMGSEAGVLSLFAACDEAFGAPDVLVNNAGVSGRNGPIVDLPADDLERLLAVNVAGYVLCCREAVRRMSTKRGGRGGSIVNVGSRAAQLGGAHTWVHYAASKGAVDSLSIGLSIEVAREGIRVNSVRPGLIDTEIHANAGMPERIATMGPKLPMGRAGTPEEVANLILWLASDEASYVSGAVIDVGGAR
ncbi:SDR family oxidoreductase [Acuticoccus sediminis]|uniref:SDR family oxidoreductase n=1 Tax=Acuticoccus sediminis TaxID=2184697 RepID=UPI001CFD8AD5|nr:SDR family oxidoreductase [Acuticoccus sediminis]